MIQNTIYQFDNENVPFLNIFIIDVMKIFGFQRHPIMSAKWLLPLMLALSSIHKGKKC